MIISRTPFRISLAGGGSDFAEYYRHSHGNVVSMAISRYMYVTVNRRFDDLIRVSYTQTEIVERVDDLQHDLIRESLRMTGVTKGVEITTIADLPAGIGLGSSSTLTVGVLNALDALNGQRRPPADLARRACEVEIEVLKKPIGKQDQYIAAFGGLQDIYFNPDESGLGPPGALSACPARSVAAAVDALLHRGPSGGGVGAGGGQAQPGRSRRGPGQHQRARDAGGSRARRPGIRTCEPHRQDARRLLAIEEADGLVGLERRSSTTSTSAPSRPAPTAGRSRVLAAAAACCCSSRPPGERACAGPCTAAAFARCRSHSRSRAAASSTSVPSRLESLRHETSRPLQLVAVSRRQWQSAARVPPAAAPGAAAPDHPAGLRRPARSPRDRTASRVL